MNLLHPFSRRLLIGLFSLGAAATLSACNQPSETTTVDPAADEPVATELEPTTADPTATGNSLVDVAASDESFSTLVTAIEAAGLSDTLATGGPYTVFAPTNEAFEALPEGTLTALLQPENQEQLAQLLTYHVLPQEVTSAEVTSGEVPTVAGPPVSIMVDEAAGSVMVNNATVVQPDVEAENGVIHAVDQVILPPDLTL
ncbi:fasciclin domain-containing protein [Almyronema epifaneia]|uniref:Fasciclin domain-containing protein n=1 Tax=Almyronema epifaneia S1 TaxID=2991925 RepID=A0ABW6IAA7_9CYAN